jgi:adenylosuccinate synthase
MVINPFKLEEELLDLERRGLLRGEVVLSDRAHVLLPVHEMEDAWQDELRAKTNPAASLGTTRRGIGPAYEDRYGRFGIRLGELSRPAVVRERLEMLYATKPYLTNLPPVAELATKLAEVGVRLAPFIRSTEPLLWEAIARNDHVLLEGAQSALLDLDFGTYPYVTSSHPTSAGAVVGSGIPPTDVDTIVGVTKAYCTRVGAGPFPTEDLGEGGEFLRRVGGERGATTGRERRCGWLDLVLLRYVARLNGLSSLAVTKVDVLGGQESVPICVGYLLTDGTTVRDISPFHADDLAKMRPVYERLPGWPAIHERTRERLRREGATALPAELRRFLQRITEETGVPVEYVGFGPGRDETVRLGRSRTLHPDAGLPAWTG